MSNLELASRFKGAAARRDVEVLEELRIVRFVMFQDMDAAREYVDAEA